MHSVTVTPSTSFTKKKIIWRLQPDCWKISISRDNSDNQVLKKAHVFLNVHQGWHSCLSARHRPSVFSLDAQVSTKAYRLPLSVHLDAHVFTMEYKYPT